MVSIYVVDYDNNNNIDNIHDVHEGVNAFVKLMLRLYELNAVRLLLSIGVIFESRDF